MPAEQNRYRSISLISILLSAWFVSCLAETSTEEENLIAALSLNIIRFSAWPEPQTTPFDLCVYGDNVTKEAFSSLEAKELGSRFLHVVGLDRLIELERCDALYINDINPNLLYQVLNDLKTKPVLTLSYSDSFAEKGGMIGLRKNNGKLVIDINLRACHEAGIVISSRLLSLANIVAQ